MKLALWDDSLFSGHAKIHEYSLIIINDFGKGVNFSSRTTEKDFELGAILSDNDNRMEGEFMIKYGYNKQSFYHCKFTAYRE